MLGMSLSSCRRYHPAEAVRSSQSDYDRPCCLRPTDEGSAFGIHSRGFAYANSRNRLSVHPRDLPLRRPWLGLHELGFPLPSFPHLTELWAGLAETPALTGHTSVRRLSPHTSLLGLQANSSNALPNGIPGQPLRSEPVTGRSSLSGRRRRPEGLTSVRRSNGPYGFPVGRFHKGVSWRVQGRNQ